MWQHVECWIKSRESTHVEMVDFGPPNHDPKHVLNSELSITLVKSNGCDLISQLASDSVTRGELWTLR